MGATTSIKQLKDIVQKTKKTFFVCYSSQIINKNLKKKTVFEKLLFLKERQVYT